MSGPEFVLPTSSVDLLDDLLGVLEENGHRSMIVGGVATFAWGDPRTTQDLDVATEAGDREMGHVKEILQGAGFEVDGPFSTEWGPRFIVPSEGGFPVDVFLDDRGRLFDRRREVRVGETTLWVKSPEDIVVEKLVAASRFPSERAQDLGDAVGILFKQGESLEASYVKARCKEEDILEFLDEARDRAEAVEEEPEGA